MKVVVSSSSEFRRVKVHLILFVLAIVSVYMEIRSIFCSKKAIYVFSFCYRKQFRRRRRIYCATAASGYTYIIGW
jgi:hypothetical protein